MGILTPFCLQQEKGTPQASPPGEEQLKYILFCQFVYPLTPQHCN
jgi:hypothetical protein